MKFHCFSYYSHPSSVALITIYSKGGCGCSCKQNLVAVNKTTHTCISSLQDTELQCTLTPRRLPGQVRAPWLLRGLPSPLPRRPRCHQLRVLGRLGVWEVPRLISFPLHPLPTHTLPTHTLPTLTISFHCSFIFLFTSIRIVILDGQLVTTQKAYVQLSVIRITNCLTGLSTYIM